MNFSRHQISGPAGPLEAALDEPGTLGSLAVVAHPHPLYGGTMQNPVVRIVARVCATAGKTTLRFNFRGVGRSAGVHDDGVGERADLKAADDWLRSRFGRAQSAAGPISMLWAGYSFGAAVALAALHELESDPAKGTESRPDALLLLAPPFSVRDFSFAASLQTPIALVTGSADELTPRSEVERAANWPAMQASVCMQGVGHDLDGEQPQRLGDAVQHCLERLAERPS